MPLPLLTATVLLTPLPHPTPPPPERCELNFGARPFQHPVEGYHPLQLEPSPLSVAAAADLPLPGGRPGQLAAARYLAGCLGRLIDVSSPSPAEAAAAAAAEPAAEQAGGSESDGEGSGHCEAGEPPLPGAPLFPAAAAGVGPRPPLGGGLLPDADMLAALAAAAGDPGSSKAQARSGSSLGRPGSAGAAGPAIDINDRVLLGAVLARHVGPLCLDPFVVEAVLLPLMDDTAGDLCSSAASAPAPWRVAADEPQGGGEEQAAADGGRGPDAGPAPGSPGAPAQPAERADAPELGRQRLAQLLQLLAAVLEPEELSALVCSSCWVRGLAC